jgi:hypothetical protein
MTDADKQLLLEADLRAMAMALEEILEEKTGEKMGFCLLVFPFGEDGRVSNYVSNANRDDMLKALQEFIDKHSAGEVIPAGFRVSQ